MKKILVLLGLLLSVVCEAQLFRPIDYKGMPAYFWVITNRNIYTPTGTTTFVLNVYFNTTTYYTEGAISGSLGLAQVVTVDSVINDDTSATTYQIIKDRSPFFNSATIANALRYSPLSIVQSISDTVINDDTCKRFARVRSCIHDPIGKVIVLSLYIDTYQENIKVSTDLIHMVVDNMFKYDGTDNNEYDHFINSMRENNFNFETALRAGIMYGDAYGIINAKLKGLR